MSTYDPETSGFDPGLDEYEWETHWEQLQEGAEDDPAPALSELADFVESILRRRGLRPDQAASGDGRSADAVGAYRFAREVSDRVERGDPVDPGDIGAAHEALREVFDWVTGIRHE